MSSGSFFAGMLVGGGVAFGAITSIALSYGNAEKNEIQFEANRYENSTEEINRLFAVTGKGLAAVEINGQKCIINIERPLSSPGVYFIACAR